MAFASTKESIVPSPFQSAEPAIACGVVAERFDEIGTAEFGPAFLRDLELGIADLPQQKVADSHFSGRADQEVGIGHAGGIGMVCNLFLVDSLRSQIAQSNFCGPGPARRSTTTPP